MIAVSTLPSSNASHIASHQVRSPDASKAAGQDQFTEEELALIAALKRRDREVRAHEQAHLAAAGQYAKGSPQYTFQKGPDGRNYAVGGEVQIDTSPVRGDPEATLRKAEAVRRAANAPASPSSQDRAIAAQAAALAIQARVELSKEQLESSGSQITAGVEHNRSSNLVNNDLLSVTYSTENRQSRLIDELI